jgi:hypothetical protein
MSEMVCLQYIPDAGLFARLFVFSPALQVNLCWSNFQNVNWVLVGPFLCPLPSFQMHTFCSYSVASFSLAPLTPNYIHVIFLQSLSSLHRSRSNMFSAKYMYFSAVSITSFSYLHLLQAALTPEPLSPSPAPAYAPVPLVMDYVY